ncbi:inheritance of peroxisomes protein 2 [Maudiozyma exigua]|uniref:Inheritance of peroxisomes protein 2 n=1 Tax=Maudiozyma exigua TaxID=34358 RepID=A0A9P6W1G0_MAUEX|nr:inheritance of peroxisomes protein 2 [Kazachstania exigua]
MLEGYTKQVYNSGLQLFMDTSNNDDCSMRTDHLQKFSRITNENLYTESDLLLSLKQRDASFSRVVQFNDSSPTIVPESPFPNDPSYIKSISPYLNNVIQFVFNDIPDAYDPFFKEEFQYNIIGSSFLHDLNSHVHPLKPKSSILDLGKNCHNSIENQKGVIITKYGKLTKEIKWTFKFDQTLNYNKTILACFKTMHILKTLPQHLQTKSKRIVIVVLITLYLTFQENCFRIHQTKIKSIQLIKKMVSLFEYMDGWISQYHLHFKELHVKENIFSLKSKTKRSGVDLSQNASISRIYDILNSSTDQIFFKLNYIIKEIMIRCNFNILQKYCEMFDIVTVDLEICLTEPANSLTRKISNINILRKFLFCCLLSITRDGLVQVNKNYNEKPYDFLKLFNQNRGQDRVYDDGKILEHVNGSLKSLNDIMNTILLVLQENKYLLNEAEVSTVTACNTDSLLLKKHSLKTHDTLETLENQINILKRYGDVTQELSDVKSHLNKLIRMVNTIPNDSGSDSELHIPQHSVSRNVSGNRSSVYGKGFSLDVLRGPSPLDTTINLNRKVEFVKIDSSDNEDDILSDTNEYMSSNEDNDNGDETIIQCEVHRTLPDFKIRQKSVHYQSMKQLSDEQLQRQLQDEILKFSAENKKSRENLRAEKSFELLKRCQTTPYDLKNNNNSIDNLIAKDMKFGSERMCLLEEGIAALYNISEQL